MSEGIAYQNKDILGLRYSCSSPHRKDLLKFLREFYENVTLDVFGLEDIPKIEKLLPNHFPEVTADEKRSDTIFQLADDSLELIAEKTGLSIEEVKEIENEYKETQKRA